MLRYWPEKLKSQANPKQKILKLEESTFKVDLTIYKFSKVLN